MTRLANFIGYAGVVLGVFGLVSMLMGGLPFLLSPASDAPPFASAQHAAASEANSGMGVGR